MSEEYLKVIGEPINMHEKRELMKVTKGLLNAVTSEDYYKLMVIYGEIAGRYEVD